MATLLYRWKFDEGSGQYAASSATSNTGTLYTSTPGDRGVVWTASGYNGAGLSCDGSSGANKGAITATSLLAVPADFTVCCWFKTSSTSTYPMVACVPTSTPSYGLALFMSANGSYGKITSMYYKYPGTGYGDDSADTVQFADGEWHHAALAIRSADGKKTLYADCNIAEDDAIGDPPFTGFPGPAYWTLGGGDIYITGPGAFNGSVDDIRVYDGYLTAAEVCDVMDDFAAPTISGGHIFAFSGGLA